MAVEANTEHTAVRGGAGARSERVRHAQARVAAAVEAGYLAQLSRDLRLTVARPVEAVEPCPGRGA